MSAIEQGSRRRQAAWTYLGDLAAVLGGGGTVSFFLANWWLSTLSPFPGLARHGAAVALAVSMVVGLLLGIRARRANHAIAYTISSLVAGSAGLGLALSAPALAGVAGGSDIAVLVVPSRVIISFFFCTPIALLGGILGASVRAGRPSARAD